MAIEIDNDNGEIRVDGYEYAGTKVKVKTYGISSESSQTGNSADLRLTDSNGYTDNVTFTGGTNVTIVQTDANKITISASGTNDTNTTYGISAESNVAPKSADLRLTGSDASTDNVTLVGGTNVTITRTDANTITFSATDVDTNTKYSISAEGSQTGNSADIRLTDSDGYIDNVTITGGSNVSIVKNSANQLTVSSSYTGFGAFTDGYNTATADQAMDTINFAAGSGIKLTVNSETDTLTIVNDGVKTFNGFNGDISYNAFGAITDGYNTAIADWPMDTFRINSGAGVSFVVDGYTDSAILTNTGVTQINQGSGITVSGQTGNVTVTNAGVRQAIAGTGISVSAGTGLVTINNTGVTGITAGTGITTSGSGNVTVNNDGVTTFNTAKGAISYNSFGVMSDGYNTATADIPIDTFTFVAGTGIGALVNNASDSITISNTGVTQNVAGTGISVSSGTGSVTINNTGVTAITAGTGISASGSGNITVSNTGVTSLNGGTGTQYQYATITDGSATTTPSSGHTSLSVVGGTGIKTTVSPDTVTISMSETSKILSTDLNINPGVTAPIFIISSVPATPTTGSVFEFRVVIMIKFAAASANNGIDLLLATNGSFTNAAADVFIGPITIGEITSGTTLITSSAGSMNDTKIHVVTVNGIIHNGGTSANISISMKNNAASILTAIAKSFMKYNVI